VEWDGHKVACSSNMSARQCQRWIREGGDMKERAYEQRMAEQECGCLAPVASPAGTAQMSRPRTANDFPAPMTAIGDVPRLLSEAVSIWSPLSPPLKVPHPREPPLDRLFGQDWVLPEEAAAMQAVPLEGGVGSGIARLLPGVGRGADDVAEAAAVRVVPGGGLKAHETVPGGARRGYTLSRHVGKTEAQLRGRLSKRRRSASGFPDRQVAEDAVSATLVTHRAEVDYFLSTAQRGEGTNLFQAFDRPVGNVVTAEGVSTTTRVKVTIVRDASDLGYFIRHAYPTR
jgi:hypothetical protein